MTNISKEELLKMNPGDFLQAILRDWPGEWNCGRKEHKWMINEEENLGHVCDQCAVEAVRILMIEINKLTGESQ